MKCKLFIFTFMLSCLTGVAQNFPNGGKPGSNGAGNVAPDGDKGNLDNGNFITGNRAYEIIVKKVDSAHEVENRNDSIKAAQNARQEKTRGAVGSALAAALKTGYGSLVSQKAVNLTSNLIDYTVSFVSTAVKNHKERFNNWYKEAKSNRQFSKTLSQQQMIGDFYALPSSKGAFDPDNIAFKGIGCRSYFSSENKDGTRNEHDQYFYIFCSLRTDSTGMQSIVNHSKFMLDIDSIYFRPNICDIPSSKKNNISGANNFFEKQNELNVTLNAKFYSSWFNEAIMLQKDQLLGSFDIVMKIDSTDCVEQNGEKVFIYRKADAALYQPSGEGSKVRAHRSEISISGDSFIVPRSYSMDASSSDCSPVWGTGEYRVDLTLSETSDINANYYYKEEYKPRNQTGGGQTSIGNAQAVSFANIPGKDYFEKSIWKAEWTEMKANKQNTPDGSTNSDSYLKGAWKQVLSTVKGSSWTTTFLSPLVNSVTEIEAKAINKALKLDSSQSGGVSSQGQSDTNPQNVGQDSTSTPTSQDGSNMPASGATPPANVLK